MPNTPKLITDEQRIYLNGLRTNDHEKAQINVVTSGPTAASSSDFANFRAFLIQNGHADPQPADRYLVVRREAVLRLLQYADDRHCLVVQTCFGFDRLVSDGGRVQLIQKGNMWQRQPGLSDDVVFNTVYKAMRNGRGFYEAFLNMDPDHHLPSGKAHQYTKNFRANYAGRTMQHDPFIHGFLLPVKPLLTIFTDTHTPLGTADTLTFRWGLTTYINDGTMGNFTLVIGTGDATTGSHIEFRTEAIEGTGVNDCPPNKACK